MPLHVNHGGSWKAATPYANDGGTWKPVRELWVNDGGTWRLAYRDLVFTPPPGSYSDSRQDSAGFTIQCSRPAAWTWSKGNPNTLVSPASGSTASSLTITLDATGPYPNRIGQQDTVFVTATVDGAAYAWDISLNAWGSQIGPDT